MPGGLLQLSAFGSASTYLHADPQITFWKQAWRRSTPFALESIEMPFNGGPADFGRKTTAAITRAADMAHRAWLEITLPDLADYYTAQVSATADQPLVLRAFFDSPTTFVVRVRKPTSTAVAWTKFRVYDATDNTLLGEDNIFEPAETTDVTITVAEARRNRTIYVVASDDAAPAATSNQSSPRDVLCLRWTNSIGHAVVDNVEWEIGGTRMDKVPNSDFFDVWAELTEKEEKREGFNAMVGKYDGYDIWETGRSHGGERTYFVPLIFSFCASPTQSIPVVALQFHEARINIAFREALECIKCNVPVAQLVSSSGTPLAIKDCRLFVDMAFLDTEERRRMVSMPHEALITQIQYLGDVVVAPDDPSITRRIPLDGLNHPIKELIWVYQPYDAYQRDAVNGNDWFRYGEDPFDLVRLTLNGSERMSPRSGQYFRQVQPYQHHTRVPQKHVHCYNFGLEPESTSPTGACNFSRLDQAALHVVLNPAAMHVNGGKIKVWALGYNVVRYDQGLAGLAFVSS